MTYEETKVSGSQVQAGFLGANPTTYSHPFINFVLCTVRKTLGLPRPAGALPFMASDRAEHGLECRTVVTV